MRGSIRRMKRAQVAPAKPPPTTTTRPPAPWAIAGSGSSAADAPAAACLRKSRRLVCLFMIASLSPFAAPYQAAIALISSSVKPLAMRPITVPGSWPDLKPSIAATMSPGLRLTRRVTEVSTKRAVGWQPLHDERPGRGVGRAGCESLADRRREQGRGRDDARAVHVGHSAGWRPPIGRSVYAFRRSWFFSGSERMRLPVAAKTALHSAGATTATGGSPTPPQNPPPLGTITVSTLGISASRSI